MSRIATAILLTFFALTAHARNMYIPVAGVLKGANNTSFRTDVRLFNPSFTAPIAVSVHFLPQGMDGANISGILVPVEPRQMVVLNDVVSTLFHMPSGSIGALRLDSNTDYDYALIADSRTYTDSPNPAVSGTYGQFIPALDDSKAMRRSVVLHLSQNAALRANAGVMNPNRTAAVVTPSLVMKDGTLIAQGADLTIPAMSMVQQSLLVMFGTDRVFDDGFIVFESSEPVFTWASVIDNQSSDQIFVPGAEDDDAIRPLPGY